MPRPKVLFVPKWYPNRLHPILGIFIRKQAKAAALHCDVAVLFVISDPTLKDKKYDLVTAKEDGIFTVRVYHAKSDVGNNPLGRIIKFQRYLKALFRGYRLVQKEWGRPDLMHVHILRRPGILALWKKWFSGIPYVVSEQWSGYLAEDGAYRGFFKKLLSLVIVRQANAAIANSAYLRDAMIRHGLFNKYYIVHNIVEIKHAALTPPAAPPFNILTIARLEERDKNIAGMIRAIDLIPDNISSSMVLHVVGDGEDRQMLHNLANDLGMIDKKVIFQGYLSNDDTYDLYKNTHLYLTNSHYETFSVTTAEALSNGVPVLTTDCGGPREYIKPGTTTLVPPGDTKALAEALAYIVEHYADYRQKSLDFDAAPLSYEKIGKDLFDIYSTVLNDVPTG